jgi:hypothetical protein
MKSLVGLAYSLPVQLSISILSSASVLIFLLQFKYGLLIFLCAYPILPTTKIIEWLINRLIEIFRWLYPTTTRIIEENMKKSFILHGDISQPGLYLWHPHGLTASSPYVHCVMNNMKEKNVVVATIPLWLRIPIWGDIGKSLKFIDSNYSTLKENIENNKSVSLVLGGNREVFNLEPKKLTLYINKRKGYLRLALETRKPLIPVITYGENELYQPSDDSINRVFNNFLKNNFHVLSPVISLESFKEWLMLHEKPLNEVNTHVGEPIVPLEDDTMETLKARYKNGLEDLFNKTRPDGYTLNII